MPNPSMPNGFAPVVSPGGYSHGGPGGVMRTPVAGGSSRYALNWDRGVQTFNVNLFLDSEQYSIWVLWFHHIIKKGSITFDMPLDSGFGLSQHAVNIIPDSYAATHTDTFILISFAVEGESKAYDFSATDAQSVIDLYNAVGDSSGALLEQIEQFALVDSNVLGLA